VLTEIRASACYNVTLRGFRFSWLWRLLSYGIWRRVSYWKI